jgi:hypothetical protein
MKRNTKKLMVRDKRIRLPEAIGPRDLVGVIGGSEVHGGDPGGGSPGLVVTASAAELPPLPSRM